MGTCMSFAIMIRNIKCSFCQSIIYDNYFMFMNLKFCSQGCRNAYKMRMLFDKNYRKI